jgi:hypothetical protein
MTMFLIARRKPRHPKEPAIAGVPKDAGGSSPDRGD